MTDGDRILRDLASGRYKLTRHARDRMAERGVTDGDIRHCADTAAGADDQGGGKYAVVGSDLSGDRLKIVAAWDGETVVITVI